MLVSEQDLDLLFRVSGVYLTNPQCRTPYVHLRANKTVYAHRVVAERMIGRKLHKAERVDHINGNGTDNRRENLRVVTHSQNLANRPGWRKSSSKYKGVTFYKRDEKWQAKICPRGKTIHLGYFEDEVDAARAYNAAAQIHFGASAMLNEVPQ
jgi:hypothetical protein